MTLVEGQSYLRSQDRIHAPDAPYLNDLLKPSDRIVYPSILQINSGVIISQLSEKYGPDISLARLPDEELALMSHGFDMVWFMGIYERSNAARNTALRYSDQYKSAFPDLDPATDVVASPFAIPTYSPSPVIAATWQEWDERVVTRLHSMNKKIILDFVPNHVAEDHPWVTEHPEYMISAPIPVVERCDPLEFEFQEHKADNRVLAHGKDGLTIPWIDTIQLNFANPDLKKLQAQKILDLSRHCDGLRFDMAHLILPHVFERNWGWVLTAEERSWLHESPFWRNVINRVNQYVNDDGRVFHFIAEAYDPNDIGALINEGFNAVYDKTGLYDTLVRTRYQTDRPAVLTQMARHLASGKNASPVLFTENHDEPRAEIAFDGKEPSQAAAVITALLPGGIWMVHKGQDEGRKIKLPMQVKRLPTDEVVDTQLAEWYERLSLLRGSALFQTGKASIPDHSQLNDSIIALQVAIENTGGAIAYTNFAGHSSEGMVPVADHKDIWMYDVTKNLWLHGDDIAKPDNGRIYVSLDPWQTQILFFA